MKHDLPKHIEGKSGAEITAFTLQAVKSIVASEAMTERTPLPASQVQQPPHMRGKMDMPEAAPAPEPKQVERPAPEIIEPAAPAAQIDAVASVDATAEMPCATQTPRKRSLLERLTGR